MNGKTVYWLDLCDDDLITAKALFKSERLLHMCFFCHMVVEKALKSVVAERTDAVPPKIHDLIKLATQAGIANELSSEQKALLEELLPLQIEARYPEYKEKVRSTLTADYCGKLLTETEEFLCWIKEQLGK